MKSLHCCLLGHITADSGEGEAFLCVLVSPPLVLPLFLGLWCKFGEPRGAHISCYSLEICPEQSQWEGGTKRMQNKECGCECRRADTVKAPCWWKSRQLFFATNTLLLRSFCSSIDSENPSFEHWGYQFLQALHARNSSKQNSADSLAQFNLCKERERLQTFLTHRLQILA